MNLTIKNMQNIYCWEEVFIVRELNRAKSKSKNRINVFSKMYVIYFYYLFNEERKNWYQRNFISNGAKNVSDEGTN
jgi:hypothetical protein